MVTVNPYRRRNSLLPHIIRPIRGKNSGSKKKEAIILLVILSFIAIYSSSTLMRPIAADLKQEYADHHTNVQGAVDNVAKVRDNIPEKEDEAEAAMEAKFMAKDKAKAAEEAKAAAEAKAADDAKAQLEATFTSEEEDKDKPDEEAKPANNTKAEAEAGPEPQTSLADCMTKLMNMAGDIGFCTLAKGTLSDWSVGSLMTPLSLVQKEL